MEWLLVIPAGVSVVLTLLIYRKLRHEHDEYIAANVQTAYMKGSAAGLVLGVASVLTAGMVFDLLVRAVKALVN